MEMMGIGNLDSMIANQIKNEDRKFELALAPVKRLLLTGAKEGTEYRNVKVTEGALLVFRKEVENFALDLSFKMGAAAFENGRVTIKTFDIDYAKAMTKTRQIEKPKEEPKKDPLTSEEKILQAKMESWQDTWHKVYMKNFDENGKHIEYPIEAIQEFKELDKIGSEIYEEVKDLPRKWRGYKAHLNGCLKTGRKIIENYEQSMGS